MLNGFAKNNSNNLSGGTFLVGYRGRLFQISDDFQVGENIEPFDTCGCGELSALGAMNALLSHDKYIKPEDLLIKALEAAEKRMCGVAVPFKIMKIKKD